MYNSYTLVPHSSFKVKVITHTNKHRVELACGRDERVLDFRLTTDDYGYETSFEWQTLGGVFASGPPSNENYDDNKTYSYKYCVKVGQQYRLKMKDKMGDGLVSSLSSFENFKMCSMQ